MAGEKRSAINSSATHVFTVLRVVAEAEQPLGVSEISRRLNLPASTIYRALMTLEQSDYIVRHQNMPRYELGSMPQLLNRALVHRFKLHASSRPILRALAEATGETVALTVRIGWYGLSLAGVYGSRDIYHRHRLGEVAPLHQEAAGRCILAFLPEEEQLRYQSFVEAQEIGSDMPDWKSFKKQLDRARGAGFEHEEISSDGLAAIALPIRSPHDGVIASLAVAGPVHDPGEEADHPEVVAARDALERIVAANPADFASPFASIPADEIVIRCAGRQRH